MSIALRYRLQFARLSCQSHAFEAFWYRAHSASNVPAAFGAATAVSVLMFLLTEECLTAVSFLLAVRDRGCLCVFLLLEAGCVKAVCGDEHNRILLSLRHRIPLYVHLSSGSLAAEKVAHRP